MKSKIKLRITCNIMVLILFFANKDDYYAGPAIQPIKSRYSL